MRRTPLDRPFRRRATPKQHQEITELADRAGFEKPIGVFWSDEARDVIERLEQIVSRPELTGFREAVSRV